MYLQCKATQIRILKNEQTKQKTKQTKCTVQSQNVSAGVKVGVKLTGIA